MHNFDVFLDDVLALKSHPTRQHITNERLLVRMPPHVKIQVRLSKKSRRANFASEILLISLLFQMQIVKSFVAKSLTTSWTLISLFSMLKDNVRSKE
jgi:hypothetical protein